MRVVSIFIGLAYALTTIFGLPVTVRAVGNEPLLNTSRIIVSSMKVSSTTEFVELHNSTTELVDVTGWVLTYINEAQSAGSLRTLATLDGSMEPGEYWLIASTAFEVPPEMNARATFSSGLADGGGFVRLFSKVDISEDYPDGFALVQTIGWKNTSTVSANNEVINYSGTGKSIKRCVDNDGAYVQRQDNSTDFYVTDIPVLGQLGQVCSDLLSVTDPEEDDGDDQLAEDDQNEIVDTEPAISCEGVVINEILPNPQGADAGKEFIELYNPSEDYIPMTGCVIETSAGTKNRFVFNDEELIGPYGYLVLSDSRSGIVLPNASGAEVRLVSKQAVEISSAVYPENMSDDKSWALFYGEYLATYTPTPGVENVYTELRPCEAGYKRNPDTNRCNKIIDTEVLGVTVCNIGQEINPLTGRCRKTETQSLVPCGPGQVRNPQTNRCRNITSSALTPCAEGQYRNPQTNRCRKIDTGELVPCKPGQDRNPETNRCRNIIQNGEALGNVFDIESSPGSSLSIMPIGMLSAGAFGYALYEWRQELVDRLRSYLRRFRR